MKEYKVDPAKCIGCTICAKNCPVNAISETADKAANGRPIHAIDPKKCIKCGVCASKCPKGAISK